METPDNPIITNCERTGYPDGDPVWPHCPICGEVTDTLYRNNKTKDILGCDNCVDVFDAWDNDENLIY